MYGEILLATDGSAHAEEAAHHAIGLAQLANARVHAVYVIETRTAYDNAIVDPETVRNNLRTDGENALEYVVTKAEDSNVDVDTAILEGIPAEEILSYTAENNIDVIVVGARGRSAFKRALLGSTTEQLLAEATVPLFVIGEEVP